MPSYSIADLGRLLWKYLKQKGEVEYTKKQVEDIGNKVLPPSRIKDINSIVAFLIEFNYIRLTEEETFVVL